MIIALPPFEPDKSLFEGVSSNNILNALPVANGWGPMPSLSVVSAALPGECRGFFYTRSASGSFRVIAGTATALYELNTTTYAWDDISGPSAPYSVPIGDSWTFTLYGDKLIAHNISDPIQSYNIDTGGDFADLAGSPPNAKYSWVAADYLVLGYLEGDVGQKTIRWCGTNNPEFWEIGKQGADYQELPEGEEILGGFGETGGFYVIQRYGMQAFTFAPASGFTFTRTVLNAEHGALAPRSIIHTGPGQFFFLAEDGFFSGAARNPIGAERVDRWFLSNVDLNSIADVQGAADPLEKIVWWRYKANNGLFYRLGYDWQLDRWCVSDLPLGEMGAQTTPGVTWDGLDAFYANIDAANEPFDSRIFVGGRPTFAAFNSDNKLAYFTGPSLQATLDTADIEMDATYRTFVPEVRVKTDAQNFTLQDGVSAYNGGAVTWSTAKTPNPRTKLVGFRSDGRLHRFRMIIPSGEVWSVATSLNVAAKVTGKQ